MYSPEPEEFRPTPPPRIRYECKDCCYATTSMKKASDHQRENPDHAMDEQES